MISSPPVPETPREESIVVYYQKLLDEKTNEYDEYVATSKEIEAELYAAIDEVLLYISIYIINILKCLNPLFNLHN